jgi:hypothetical protein
MNLLVLINGMTIVTGCPLQPMSVYASKLDVITFKL